MLLSVHIPKTAGTSFRVALQEAIGPGLALAYRGRVVCGDDVICGFEGRSLDHLSPSDAEALVAYCEENAVACIHGHFSLHALRDLFPDAECITFLREPLSRLISAYNHMFVTMPERAARMSFEDFVRTPRTQNVYESHGVLEYIDGFRFLGLTEHYDRSLELLAALYPDLGRLSAGRENVSSLKRFRREDVDEAFCAELRQLNDGDFTIYETVAEWFEEECEAQGI